MLTDNRRLFPTRLTASLKLSLSILSRASHKVGCGGGADLGAGSGKSASVKDSVPIRKFNLNNRTTRASRLERGIEVPLR